MSEIRRITLRQRGQITIPADIARELRLLSGDKVNVEVVDGALRLTPSRRGILAARDALHAAFVASGVSEEEFQEELRRVRAEMSPEDANQRVRRKSA